MSKEIWKWIAAGGSVLVFKGLNSGLEQGYKKLTGKEPPANPAVKGVKVREAILWTILASVVAGVGKLLFDSSIAHKWREDAVKPQKISD